MQLEATASAPSREVEVIRSSRKTLALEVREDGRVLVRAPLRCSRGEILAFLEKSRPWLARRLAERERREAALAALPKLSEDELRALKSRAKQVFSERAACYAPLVGVRYAGVSVRFQHSRWGSCSSRGTLSFNGLLLLAPEAVLDYVVVHELCHRLEMNHSPRFWAEVGRVLPGWAASRRWLRENGDALLARLPE